ncbi:hypothetical protein BKG70_23190 [Mycobacteroides chelonae]|nr:hypothetical protein BKG66_24860 [Mycobacteroides chelonae]OHT69494.1 hypothetical protein BKG67_23395 [Mycobacteroides chelonae]OHT84353.1 hypothetical protein BKG70_23190 [Mycobacteroides chelonae]
MTRLLILWLLLRTLLRRILLWCLIFRISLTRTLGVGGGSLVVRRLCAVLGLLRALLCWLATLLT